MTQVPQRGQVTQGQWEPLLGPVGQACCKRTHRLRHQTCSVLCSQVTGRSDPDYHCTAEGCISGAAARVRRAACLPLGLGRRDTGVYTGDCGNGPCRPNQDPVRGVLDVLECVNVTVTAGNIDALLADIPVTSLPPREPPPRGMSLLRVGELFFQLPRFSRRC